MWLGAEEGSVVKETEVELTLEWSIKYTLNGTLWSCVTQ